MTVDPTVKPDAYAIPTEWPLDDDDRTHRREQTWTLILRGCSDAEQYLELFEEELVAAGVAEGEATAFFQSVIDLRLAQQASWGEMPTTNLTRAFEELESIGVVARQDFTCCGTCGSAEIGDERDDSRTWRGYVYFHTQDTDHLVEDRATYIGFGAFPNAYYTKDEWFALSEDEREATYARLATELMKNEVIPILTAHDIEVTWTKPSTRGSTSPTSTSSSRYPPSERSPSPALSGCDRSRPDGPRSARAPRNK